MAKKGVKQLKGDENKEEKEDLSLAKVDQPDNLRHAGDCSEPSSLIHQLGRDLSINCLIHCSRFDHGVIASLNSCFHSVIKSGELYRRRREGGIAEHWVYFSCNLSVWEAFDPIYGRLMRLPKINCSDCFMFSDKESLAVGTELLVFGRDIMSNAICKYSVVTRSWTSGALMNTPRCLFGSASLGEIGILGGGCDPLGNVLDSAELYNSETGEWMTIPSLNKARKMCSAVFMDGKFYIIGGTGVGKSEKLTCGEVYDLKTKTWQLIPNMYREQTAASSSMEAPPLVGVVNNQLYLADHALKVVKKYDKEENRWETVGPLPERATSMNGWGMAFRACGELLIIITGQSDEGVIEIYSWAPSDGPVKWDLLVRKPSCSFVYNCAVMGC
ncbi:hypothetical protein GQ457_15G005780 [Hibiscus cannabinus]